MPRINKLSLLFFICLIGIASTVQAQHLDSIRNSFKQESTFLLHLDSYNSFVGGKFASVTGIKVGLNYGRLVRVGINLAGLTNPYYSRIPAKNYNGSGDTSITSQLKFSYLGFFFDYTIYQKKRWMFSIPLQLGFGSSRYEYYKKDEGLMVLNSGGIILFDPAVLGHYKITRWFGIAMGAGFRFMLLPNPQVSESFTSPIYVLKFKIFFGELYYMAFPKGITGKRKPRDPQYF